MIRALFLVVCAGRALAQHESHTRNAAGVVPPRFDFSVSLIHADHGSLRGERKLAIREWDMFRTRGLFGDRVTFRAMTSVGSLLRDSAGMPSLLQTGGTYRHSYVHDRQHPDDLVIALKITRSPKKPRERNISQSRMASFRSPRRLP